MVSRFVEVGDELPRTQSFRVKKGELRAAGITAQTWDREQAGIKLRGQRLS
jgi:crotonobetaine/carnitine-CoA ligase